MISKAKQRLVKSLQSKKIRQKHQLFLVQGEKVVSETLDSDYQIDTVFVSNDFAEKYSKKLRGKTVIEASEKELRSVGTLETNSSAIAVVHSKTVDKLILNQDEIGLMLDNVRDPGNLGTIIRTADWFGIQKIVASTGTVDLYNPKVISSTMGSFTRVDVHYTDLEQYIDQNNGCKYIGTAMSGLNINDVEISRPSLLCLGNESNGISERVLNRMDQLVTISGSGRAESLNVAVAAGIVMNSLL